MTSKENCECYICLNIFLISITVMLYTQLTTEQNERLNVSDRREFYLPLERFPIHLIYLICVILFTKVERVFTDLVDKYNQ